jgi:hypothetical protein
VNPQTDEDFHSLAPGGYRPDGALCRNSRAPY